VVKAGPMGATFEHQEDLHWPSLCREAAEICMLRTRGETDRMMELQRHKVADEVLFLYASRTSWLPKFSLRKTIKMTH